MKGAHDAGKRRSEWSAAGPGGAAECTTLGDRAYSPIHPGEITGVGGSAGRTVRRRRNQMASDEHGSGRQPERTAVARADGGVRRSAGLHGPAEQPVYAVGLDTGLRRATGAELRT